MSVPRFPKHPNRFGAAPIPKTTVVAGCKLTDGGMSVNKFFVSCMLGLRRNDTMTAIEERVAPLGGCYERLATKADIYKVAVQLGLFMTAVVTAAMAYLKTTA